MADFQKSPMQMDDSHIVDHIQSQPPNDPDQELDDLLLQSQLMLSNVQIVEPRPPDSPKINLGAAQAKIKELSKTADPPVKKSKPYCGCGQYYSCTSSLYLHIRSKHSGIPPPGTIGGPKGIVKKPNFDQNGDPTVKIEQQQKQKNLQAQQSMKIVNHVNIPSTSHTDYSNFNNNVVLGNRIMRRRQQNGNIACKLCGKTYSCNSALNLHLKRKHQIKKLPDGRNHSEMRGLDDRSARNFQCSICGLNYGSKSALGLHYNNKHNAKSGTADMLPYDQNIVQKCGCGLVYQSRSALNMHVKKKHNGDYPEGTSEKPNLRSRTSDRPDSYRENTRMDKYFIQEASQEEKHSIYDSQSQENRNGSKEKQSQKINKNLPFIFEEEKIKQYKCGCGRPYSCSSALNLHIKKNHNWIIPSGTIGGPRGMRTEQEERVRNESPQQKQKNQKIDFKTPSNLESQKNDKNQRDKEDSEEKGDKQDEKQQKYKQFDETDICGSCANGLESVSFFRCVNCDNHHILCSKCFWVSNNFLDDHEWKIYNDRP